MNFSLPKIKPEQISFLEKMCHCGSKSSKPVEDLGGRFRGSSTVVSGGFLGGLRALPKIDPSLITFLKRKLPVYCFRKPNDRNFCTIASQF